MRPLEGVRVLDLTTVLGFATMELADYGAEVIKVERPGSGDSVRTYPPLKEGVSLYQAFMDRGKKSITLNFRTDEGKEILKELVKDCDILIENFKVGTMEKLGLGYEELKKINPRLVYGQLTSYGSTGPDKDRIAYDITIQAKSGVMEITGDPDPGQPTKVGAYLGDHYSCTYLCAGVLLALYHARATGVGQKVETSMFEALFSAIEDRLVIYDYVDKNTTRSGNAHPSINPYDILECKDGYFALGVSTDAQWHKFCEEFGKPEWIEDPRYSTNEHRGEHYFGDLRNRLENEVTKNYTKAELADRCAKIKVPGAGANTIEESLNQEQLKVRNMLVDVEDQRIGKLMTVNKIVKFHDEYADNPTRTAPLLGQNNEEIYGPLLGEARMKQLAEAGII